MKPMKFFNFEKNHVFKKMSTEFNFKAFSGLILIRFVIALQLIDWCHQAATCYNKRQRSQKFIYLNFDGGFFDVSKYVFGKLTILEVKKFHGLHDDIKIIRKTVIVNCISFQLTKTTSNSSTSSTLSESDSEPEKKSDSDTKTDPEEKPVAEEKGRVQNCLPL